MSSAVMSLNSPGFNKLYDYGISIPRIGKLYKKEMDHYQEPISISQPVKELYEVLDEVYNECSEPDWDGYGALPVTEANLDVAKRFIELLSGYVNKLINPSSRIEIPDILAEPSGEIGFEWRKGTRSIFIVSVDSRNTMSYAGIFGGNKIHGTEYFGDNIPQIIIDSLNRLYS